MTNAFIIRASVLALLPLFALLGCGDDGMQAEFERIPDAAVDDAESEDAAEDAEDASTDADADTDDAAPEDASTPLDAALDASEERDASENDAGGEVTEFPSLLSQTGLYADIKSGAVQRDVKPFEPRFALWSDAAAKQRWLKLPPHTQIDTRDMDAWVFPVGTKAFKEFRAQGVRVETRLLHKVSSTRWVMVAYRWRADQSDAEAVPLGAENTHGTAHDIPSAAQCAQCHDASQDALLGVSALQFSHERDGENLERLKRAGLLSKPPEHDFQIPGGPVVEQALGYLHANCGHCHREGTATHKRLLKRAPYTGGPILWERVDALQRPEYTVGYRSTLNQPNGVLPDLPVIAPGKPEKSELFIRIGERGNGSLQMPPLGTERVDEQGVKAVRTWIESLVP